MSNNMEKKKRSTQVKSFFSLYSALKLSGDDGSNCDGKFSIARVNGKRSELTCDLW
jgi:hypothetical protein